MQAVCTEAGMFALRERRIHVRQEDLEMAVAKVYIVLRSAQLCYARARMCAGLQVMKKDASRDESFSKLWM